ILSTCGALGVLALLSVIPHRSHHREARASPRVSAPPRPLVDSETGSTPSERRFDWRQVESTNYGMFIKNLRASGLPEQTVRDIVIAEINQLFDSKKREAALSNRVEYWKTGNVLPRDRVRAKLVEQHQRFESERMATLKQLLGDTAPIERRPANITDADVKFNLLDFMPVEERPKVLEAINEVDATYESRFVPRLASN